MNGPAASLSADGKRLRLQYGPIDLIIAAEGDEPEVAAAHRQAEECFATILIELVAELPLLRAACKADGARPRGRVAARMVAACLPHCDTLITPMAAVAGAVADHVLEEMLRGRRLERLLINNGGDIAIHLSPGHMARFALCANPLRQEMIGNAVIRAEDPVRGIATSGWRGRSFSLGAADMVTVLARNAAAADAAATLIANAADPGACAKILRRPAVELAPDSDLGDLAVTVEVRPLSPAQRMKAAGNAAQVAEAMRKAGRIVAAVIAIQGEYRVVGSMEISESKQDLDTVPLRRLAR